MSFVCFAGRAAAAPAGQISEFSAGLAPGNSSLPANITPGPDGNLWFTDRGPDAVGRITPSGTITEFSSPVNPNSYPEYIASGPDGNLWFTDQGTPRAIGRITPDGAMTGFVAGLQPGGASEPTWIAPGPDGNVWFIDAGTIPAIGRITPSGTITEFPSAHIGFFSYIAPGADGNMWFTEQYGAIGRITPSGAITEFTTGLNTGSYPLDIAPGPDGNLWFADQNVADPAIGRITPDGKIKEFSTGLQPGNNSRPLGIAPGPDGNMWFTDLGNGTTKAIGRITPDGTISEFSTGLQPSNGSHPLFIAPGADGNMWFTDQGTTEAIGQIGAGAPAASQAPPSVSGSGIVNTPQACQPGAWATWAGVTPSVSFYSFDGYQWLRDGAAIAGQNAQTYTPTAGDVGHQLSCKITVTYPLPLLVTTSATSAAITVQLPQHTLTVGLAGNGSGTVTGSSISCPSACSHSYVEGTTVQLTATAAPGSKFAGWSEGGCSTSGPCNVTISSDAQVQATFALLLPVHSVPPAITGITTQGQTLSTSDGSWLYNVGAFRYQWQRCTPACANIAVATGRSYTLTAADLDARIRVLVTATNTAGSAQAASSVVGPVTPPLSQIKATLLSQLAPSGKTANIATVLKKGGYTFSFKAPSAGRVVIDWYYVPKGAKISKAKPKPVLVATGKASLSRVGRVKLTIKLTRSGKQMLERARSVKLTSKGTFTPAGKKAVAASKTITLRR